MRGARRSRYCHRFSPVTLLPQLPKRLLLSSESGGFSSPNTCVMRSGRGRQCGDPPDHDAVLPPVVRSVTARIPPASRATCYRSAPVPYRRSRWTRAVTCRVSPNASRAGATCLSSRHSTSPARRRSPFGALRCRSARDGQPATSRFAAVPARSRGTAPGRRLPQPQRSRRAPPGTLHVPGPVARSPGQPAPSTIPGRRWPGCRHTADRPQARSSSRWASRRGSPPRGPATRALAQQGRRGVRQAAQISVVRVTSGQVTGFRCAPRSRASRPTCSRC